MNDRRAERIAEARMILKALKFPPQQSNERSALVLLSLLGLPVDRRCADAQAATRRTVEIMAWLRDQYDKEYRANTRETIRRQTLHQFVSAGLVVLNPDDPQRAINSPQNCYQVASHALELMRTYGTTRWDATLESYLENVPGLLAQYERARDLDRIPVTLSEGSVVELTPGGQNVLIKQIIEEFCSRWTPQSHVLYIGDAGREDPVYDVAALSALGVELDKHGKFPDVIVYDPARKWLVLIEAASSHGPVDAKRYCELRELFDGASAGLVLVSCFLSRSDMRKFLSEIAWETEVWCADNPTHLIHFDGERFLGPYA